MLFRFPYQYMGRQLWRTRYFYVGDAAEIAGSVLPLLFLIFVEVGGMEYLSLESRSTSVAVMY